MREGIAFDLFVFPSLGIEFARYRPSSVDVKQHLITCLPLMLVVRLPEIFTGICSVSLALERYLLVHPAGAQDLLCRRNRIVAYSIAATLTLLLTLFEAVYNFVYNFQPYSCMFFPSFGYKEYSSVVSAVLLYLIPASTSVAIYSKLLRTRRDVLTFVLLLNCLFWILLWGVAYTIRFLDSFFACRMHELMVCLLGFYHPRVGIPGCAHGTLINEFWFQFADLNYLLGTFTALVNSLCLLFICNKSWESVVAAVQKLHRFIRDRST